MNRHRSARTCLWLSGILLLLGGAIANPGAGLGLQLLAALAAAAGIALGSTRSRLVGGLLLLAALGLAFATWPAAKQHQNQYMDRVKNKAAASGPAKP